MAVDGLHIRDVRARIGKSEENGGSAVAKAARDAGFHPKVAAWKKIRGRPLREGQV